jgi:hypothetical protein
MTFNLDLASSTAALAKVPKMLELMLKPMKQVQFRRAHIMGATLDAIQVEVEFTVADSSLQSLLDTKQAVLLGAIDGFAKLELSLAQGPRKPGA